MKRELEQAEVPGEREACERTWAVVAGAFAERQPVERSRHGYRPALVAAVAVAVLVAAVSPPGQAVVDEIRGVVGVEHAQPALYSLPAPGKLLVSSDAGIWVVQQDGSRRLLGEYREATWSPFGRFVVASRANELAAVEPDGHVRWSLGRPRVRFPRWAGGSTDTRIAYLSGSDLRVVAGDGTGDRLLARRVAPVAPAWQRGPGFVLAFVDQQGRVQAIDTESGVAVNAETIVPGHQRVRSEAGLTARIRGNGGADRVVVGGRVVFRGTGEFRDLAWSPDGRWLLVTWPTADQWVFVRVAGKRKIVAVAGITRQFGGGTFPRIAGWCCSS